MSTQHTVEKASPPSRPKERPGISAPSETPRNEKRNNPSLHLKPNGRGPFPAPSLMWKPRKKKIPVRGSRKNFSFHNLSFISNPPLAPFGGPFSHIRGLLSSCVLVERYVPHPTRSHDPRKSLACASPARNLSSPVP